MHKILQKDKFLNLEKKLLPRTKLLNLQKNQVTSIWEYDDEKHMKEVRSYLSQYNSIPNSLSPKEIAYHGEVKVSANNKE